MEECRQLICSQVWWKPDQVGNSSLHRQVDADHLMECVIYNELKARGASVDVGVVETELTTASGKRQKVQLEIDFVVNLGMEKIYIQSAYELGSPAKIEQETRGLNKIDDSFRKLIVTGGVQPFYTDGKGVSRVGIIDFLLDHSVLNRMVQ